VQFTPTAYDQFGIAQPTPASLAWTVTGAGSVPPRPASTTGSAAGGSTDTIKASAGAISASATVTVASALIVAPPVSSGISYVTGFSKVD